MDKLLVNVGAISALTILFALVVAVIVVVIILTTTEKRIKKGFSLLSKDMTREQVITLLGKPKESTEQQLVWTFLSLKGNGGKFKITVNLDNDKVVSFLMEKLIKEKPVKEKDNRNIISVSVLGIRTGMETRVLATYNFTVYSLLVKYDNGTQDVIECSSESNEFKKLVPFIQDKTSLNQN